MAFLYLTNNYLESESKTTCDPLYRPWPNLQKVIQENHTWLMKGRAIHYLRRI